MDKYNPDELKEVTVGEKKSTKVIEIVEGNMGEFMSEGYWTNSKLNESQISEAKKRAAIEVKTENGTSMVLALPPENEVNPKSNLGLWKKTYGEYPKVGQEVTTKVGDNGYLNIVLEK